MHRSVIHCNNQQIQHSDATGLLEFSSGPGSDAHAGGWNQYNILPEHLDLNVVGGLLGDWMNCYYQIIMKAHNSIDLDAHHKDIINLFIFPFIQIGMAHPFIECTFKNRFLVKHDSILNFEQ